MRIRKNVKSFTKQFTKRNKNVIQLTLKNAIIMGPAGAMVIPTMIRVIMGQAGTMMIMIMKIFLRLIMAPAMVEEVNAIIMVILNTLKKRSNVRKSPIKIVNM